MATVAELEQSLEIVMGAVNGLVDHVQALQQDLQTLQTLGHSQQAQLAWLTHQLSSRAGG